MVVVAIVVMIQAVSREDVQIVVSAENVVNLLIASHLSQQGTVALQAWPSSS